MTAKGAAPSRLRPAIRVPIRPAPYRIRAFRFLELIRPMRTRTRFSLRLARRLLALAAAFLLAATAALADQASLVSTAAPGNSISSSHSS